MNTVNIVSLNVNGLTTPAKRGKVLQKLKKEKIHFALLQETHLHDEEHEKLKKLGFKNSFYSSYKQGRKRGVAILISNSTKFNFEKEIKEKEGRYIIVKGKLEDEFITLVNIYAPPESDKHFFKSMFDAIASEIEGTLICGGDLNIILNHKLDTTSTLRNKKSLSKFVKLSLEELGLTDVWRIFNPFKRDFTHYSASHKVHSRIDYFFVNKPDLYKVNECKIGCTDVSDHNTLYMKMNISNRKKQTLWRLNVSILNNETTVKEIKEEIENYIEQNDNDEVNPTIVWDALKAVIRGKIISKTAWLKKMKMQTYEEYSGKVKDLEQLFLHRKTPEIYQQICDAKARINKILEEEVEKKYMYFRQSYYEMGPKSTKLLAKRLRKQQSQNTIYKIKNPHTNSLTHNPEEIENIFKTFYENLYTQPPSASEEEKRNFLQHLDLPSIGTNQNDTLTAEISKEEIIKAINTLKNNKSPGSDGFPAEWYKVFKNELVAILYKSLNWTLKENKMPASWSEAIISVIPKPGKNKACCSNYRPISVLNIDYKIYTSIISRRLNKFVSEIIDEDQTGFMRERQTHDNIRKAIHIIEKAQREKRSTVLLSIDAEKAFDCVNWNFLYLVLEKMGFNSKSVQLIKTLYSQPKARIKINGNLTEEISLQRSTRQGCGLSPTLFSIFIEPLAQAVRQSEEIKGVTINGVEHKIGLFADDVIAFLEQPDKSLPALMSLLETFGYLSGYKINISKTQTLTFNYTPSQNIKNMYQLDWKRESIKYLGIEITQNFYNLNKKNYTQVQENILKDMERWATLPLDLSSRVEIVKMNILPRFLFLFQALPVEVTQTQFTSWDKIISRFIWEGKRPRIKYGTLQLPKEKGGMALPKLREYYQASQLKYIYCWCNPFYSSRWKDIEVGTLEQPIQSFLGDKENYDKNKMYLNPIIKHTFSVWFGIIKTLKIQKHVKKLKWVSHDKKFVPAKLDQSYKYWERKGITAWCVLENNGRLESFQNLEQRFELGRHDFFRFLQMRDYYNKEIQVGPSMEESNIIQIMIKAYKGSNIRMISALYKALISADKHTTQNIKAKWEKEFCITIQNTDWMNMWKFHYTTTSSRMWREFAWKNLIRFFITPKIKSKQLKTHQSCWRRCGEIDVDHSHIFWKCPKLSEFWKFINTVLGKVLGYVIPLKPELYYLCNFYDGLVQEGDRYLLKIMLISAKKCITRKWGQTVVPSKEQWMATIEQIYTMEKLTHRLRLQEPQMDKKWKKWTLYRQNV